jgi:hypothetical protein
MINNLKTKNLNFKNQFNAPKLKSYRIENITDSEGLRRAYQQGDYYVHQDKVGGDKLFIAGSHTAKDWYDDVTKIPFWGDLRESDRYKNVVNVLKDNKNISTIIGHSLGGSVSLELQKNFNDRQLKTRTYGAPVFDPFGFMNDKKNERYRNWFDPVSLFDRGANNSIKWNPLSSGSLTHDFTNIADNVVNQDVVENLEVHESS